MRWNGHTDQPSDFAGAQPKAGFHPIGSILWFKGAALTVHGNYGETTCDREPQPLDRCLVRIQGARRDHPGCRGRIQPQGLAAGAARAIGLGPRRSRVLSGTPKAAGRCWSATKPT